MSTYIALLFMIVPGFISREIYDKMNQERKRNNKFEETIISLIFSAFILVLNFAILILVSKLHNISSFAGWFNSIPFTLYYMIQTLILSVITAILWSKLNYILMGIINKSRNQDGKNKIIIAESIWDLIFDDGKKHAVIIEKDGKEYAQGYIKKISHSVNTREVYLIGQNEIKEHPEYFNKTKGIYIDFEKNIKISEYDLSKLHADLKRK